MRACVMMARAHEQVQVPRRRAQNRVSGSLATLRYSRVRVLCGTHAVPTARYRLCFACSGWPCCITITPSRYRAGCAVAPTECAKQTDGPRAAADKQTNKQTNGSYSPSVLPLAHERLPPARPVRCGERNGPSLTCACAECMRMRIMPEPLGAAATKGSIGSCSKRAGSTAPHSAVGA